MNAKPMHETISALTVAERADLADMIGKLLNELPAADDPVDAGLRHSFNLAASHLNP